MKIKKWSEIISDGGLVVALSLDDVRSQGDVCPLVIYGADVAKPAMESFPPTMPSYEGEYADGFNEMEAFEKSGSADVESVGAYSDHMETMHDPEKEMVVYEVADLKIWRDKLDGLIEVMGDV